MASNLPQSIADILAQYKSRPFDSALKETLKEPGVASLLWKDYCQSELVKAFPKSDRPISIPKDITWLDQEFRTKQATWRADLIGRIGRTAVLHIEQQTDHEPVAAARRLMLYAANIATYFNFKRQIIQIYYYTGDAPMKWEKRVSESALVDNSNGAITNRFLAIDSGSHDPARMLASNDFNYAVLGLLARNIPDERSFVKRLIALARSQFDSTDRMHKLVHCVTIAFLRGRAEIVWNEVTLVEKNNMLQDPFWSRIVEDVRTETRKRHVAIFRLMEDFKSKFDSKMSDDDLDRILDIFSWDDIETMRQNLEVAEFAGQVFANTAFLRPEKKKSRSFTLSQN
ncbi:hypothetical protein [Rhizobium leguminosarum]|uniref:hypothetical protein n=1 Tax=Rhizobium leguminosarum TaxID=384 RepID=UPI00103A23A1|nr:hypothetical protein [Rhizobium leguminosarum]MBB4331657.1 hypothetical protein [Rhizobium leguminosarum]MBB4357064.1 hypothetical protein [Rhizobium leguminosarum]MBB4551624.1 hypothetical protein [Rhizobium leguminosarum]MBB4564217.1 hypothetical protein [Rhizobium leguminosarum]TBZ57190.1 hypothetical protein E0H48_17220 [Rhizobium leguminosarum bv. viciae]